MNLDDTLEKRLKILGGGSNNVTSVQKIEDRKGAKPVTLAFAPFRQENVEIRDLWYSFACWNALMKIPLRLQNRFYFPLLVCNN